MDELLNGSRPSQNGTVDTVNQEEQFAPSRIDYEPDEQQMEKDARSFGHIPTISWYIQKITKYRLLSYEETTELAKLGEIDDKAREKLVLHNLRLVISMAKRYKDFGLSFEDLIQEGNRGLIKSVERFDYRKGYRLSTYATWWIRSTITRALSNQSATIRLPVHKSNARRQIKRVAIDLQSKLSRRPTIEEISCETNHSIDEIRETFEGSGTVVRSMDQPLLGDDGEERSQYDLRADTYEPNPATVMMAKDEARELRESIGRLLHQLKLGANLISERNARIFRRFYSLDGRPVIYTTLDTVCQEFGLTRQAIEQVINRVWKKLNSMNPPPQLNGLKLERLLKRIRDIEGQTGDEILITEVTPEVINHGQAVECQQPKRRNKKRITHFRASPTYINWRPNGSGSKDIGKFAIEIAGYAYETPIADIVGTRDVRLITWVRGVAKLIMRSDAGLDWEAIARYFKGDDAPEYAEYECKEIKAVCSSDDIVRNDVEGIRSHFRKVTGL